MINILEIIATAATNQQIKIVTGPGADKIHNLPTDPSTLILHNVLNTAYFVVGTLAVLIIILAGYTFVSSSYDPAKVAIAKNAILYAVVGLIAVIVAFFVTQFVLQHF
jgi:hypothetical protein